MWVGGRAAGGQEGVDLNRMQKGIPEDRCGGGGVHVPLYCLQMKNVTLSSFFPISPSFSVFSLSISLSVSSCCSTLMYSIFSSLSTSAMSLIPPLPPPYCSGSPSFDRHNKAVLRFLLHCIPTVHPSLTKTLPSASDTPTHLRSTL